MYIFDELKTTMMMQQIRVSVYTFFTTEKKYVNLWNSTKFVKCLDNGVALGLDLNCRGPLRHTEAVAGDGSWWAARDVSTAGPSRAPCGSLRADSVAVHERVKRCQYCLRS